MRARMETSDFFKSSKMSRLLDLVYMITGRRLDDNAIETSEVTRAIPTALGMLFQTSTVFHGARQIRIYNIVSRILKRRHIDLQRWNFSRPVSGDASRTCTT